MERVPLYCQGERRGEVTLALWGPNGARTEIVASMDDPGDGLYRAFLLGERGELPLGVLAPEKGRLAVCRRLYNRDVSALGQLRFLRERLHVHGRGWWRREEGLLLLALPLERGKPFPLEALFCLGRIESVEGRRCVVYAFREEEPVLP